MNNLKQYSQDEYDKAINEPLAGRFHVTQQEFARKYYVKGIEAINDSSELRQAYHDMPTEHSRINGEYESNFHRAAFVLLVGMQNALIHDAEDLKNDCKLLVRFLNMVAAKGSFYWVRFPNDEMISTDDKISSIAYLFMKATPALADSMPKDEEQKKLLEDNSSSMNLLDTLRGVQGLVGRVPITQLATSVGLFAKEKPQANPAAVAKECEEGLFESGPVM